MRGPGNRTRAVWGVLLLIVAIVAGGAMAALTGDTNDPGVPAPGRPSGGAPGQDLAATGLAGETLFVSPTGSDAGLGTRSAPFRTIGPALEAARGGEGIAIFGGTYPSIRDTEEHSKTVRIVGVGPSRPRIAGAELAGARRIEFSRVSFTAPVLVRGDPVQSYERPSEHISFSRSDFRTDAASDASDACVTIRDRSSFIAIQRSRLHDCFSGVVGPGNSPTPHSHHITIADNLIEDVPSDGIQFGEWDDVTIHGNVIRHMRDPAGEIHNDGVQFVGDSRHVRITGNRIYDSGGQLVFVQDAFGPIDDVLVQNNLIYGSDAIAIQSQGATNARYLYNTVWDTRYGALLLRQGMTGAIPRDTVVVGNVLESFEVTEGADTRYRDYNLIDQHEGRQAPHELVSITPRFRHARRNDYRLQKGSPTVGRGDHRWAPTRDIDGRQRGQRPSLGAYEFVP